MGTPMEGFFDRVNVVAEAMASTSATTQGAPAEAPIPSSRPSPVEESGQTESGQTNRVGESVPIPAEIPNPRKGITLIGASQTGSAFPATPFVIFANDPFVTLS